MRRTTSMAFAAGMHVYPGGAVEESDSRVPLAGRADLGAVARAACRATTRRRCSAAAARETFEECGVLLARRRRRPGARRPTLVSEAERDDARRGPARVRRRARARTASRSTTTRSCRSRTG